MKSTNDGPESQGHTESTVAQRAISYLTEELASSEAQYHLRELTEHNARVAAEARRFTQEIREHRMRVTAHEVLAGIWMHVEAGEVSRAASGIAVDKSTEWRTAIRTEYDLPDALVCAVTDYVPTAKARGGGYMILEIGHRVPQVSESADGQSANSMHTDIEIGVYPIDSDTSYEDPIRLGEVEIKSADLEIACYDPRIRLLSLRNLAEELERATTPAASENQ